MSSEILLKAAGISKVYSGSSKPLATLRHALFGTPSDASDEYPVLMGIDIEISRGETVGIMGRNGAGKTTLLGILGNVIQPTAGTITRSGRIATLLGLTAGFNSNFSGRENAYLFCSIQGLSRKEADERIEGIRTFADLGRYFDMPLQSYSSGMQARLAFSCAVHVDADLIIIDETLAVGDANFRMKCYDRIRHMKQSGQTFLLVSHSQNIVANFCTRAIVLDGGKKLFDGATFDGIEAYKHVRAKALMAQAPEGQFQVRKGLEEAMPSQEVNLRNFTLEDVNAPSEGRALVRAELIAERDIENATLNFGLRDHQGIAICAWDGAKAGLSIPVVRAGQVYPVEFTFAKRLLPGRFFLTFSVHEVVGDVSKPLAIFQNVLSFDMIGDGVMSGMVDLQMQARFADAIGDNAS